MKRFAIIIAIFALAIGGYAYYQYQQTLVALVAASQPGEQEPEDEVQEIGVVSSLAGISVPGSGTHLLTKPDKSTVLLVGLGTNLDNYLLQSVEVAGRLTKTASGKLLIQVLRASPLLDTSDPGASKDDQKWEAFLDSNFGITFQQRHGWEVEKTSSSITFRMPASPVPTTPADGDTLCDSPICPPSVAPIGSTITITRIPNLKGVPLADYAAKGGSVPTRNVVGVRKLIGYKTTATTGGTTTFYVSREKDIFTLAYAKGSPGATGDIPENDFFTLIHSFDFTVVGS